MKRYCGHRYNGPLPHIMEHLKFKDNLIAGFRSLKDGLKNAYRTYDSSKLFEHHNGFMTNYCPESLGKTFAYDIKEN